MKKFQHLDKLLPHMEKAFISFYDAMLKDSRLAVFFENNAQILNLIEMQKKHLISSLTMEETELKNIYVKLGEYHYDIRIPYIDFMKGTEILQEYFLLHTQEEETDIALMYEIFEYFKVMKGYTAKGYLNKMLEEDQKDIETFFEEGRREDSYLPKSIVLEKITWLRELLKIIANGNSVDIDNAKLESESVLSSWLEEMSFLSPEKKIFFEDLEKRIVINTQNLFYFLQKEEYLEILPLYSSLLSIYKLTLMMNNALTIEYACHIIQDMEVDGLTGLYRKELLEDLVKKEIALSKRDSEHIFSLVYIDLDNFKNINDTFGHYSGDKVIEEVGKKIRENIRASDVGFRIGGDEFAILLKSANVKVAKKVAQKIKADFSAKEFIFNENIVFNVGMSIGINEYKSDMEYVTFIEGVDQKLYEAKNKGKNQISF